MSCLEKTQYPFNKYNSFLDPLYENRCSALDSSPGSTLFSSHPLELISSPLSQSKYRRRHRHINKDSCFFSPAPFNSPISASRCWLSCFPRLCFVVTLKRRLCSPLRDEAHVWIFICDLQVKSSNCCSTVQEFLSTPCLPFSADSYILWTPLQLALKCGYYDGIAVG